jgi:hypothetical protein
MAGRDVTLEAWDVDPGAFPTSAAPEERLAFLVRFAVLAPNSHNTQPWRFRVAEHRLDLYADRTRRLPVVDPQDRALTISCGAALGTLRVAAAHLGIGLRVSAQPDRSHPDLLASIVVDDGATVETDLAPLLAAVPMRRSNRRAYEPAPVPAPVIEALVAAAAAEGVVAKPVLTDQERASVADLVAAGDRAQLADRAFRAELAAWIRPNRSAAADGMRGHAFGMGDLVSRLGPWFIRTVDTGRSQAAKDRGLAAGSPLLLLLATGTDGVEPWLRTGQALQRVLLTARTARLWSAHLNQPVEVPGLRPQLASLLGVEGRPQLLLRLGAATGAPPPSPRRPMPEVLELGTRAP